MDVVCNDEYSTKAAINQLMDTYSLSTKIPEDKKRLFLATPLKPILEGWIPQKSHPSPRWVNAYGLAALIGQDRTMSPDVWLERRMATRARILARSAFM